MLAIETRERELAFRSAVLVERQPWDRMDGESFAAFSRFVLYRNTPPGQRSMRKLGVSGTTAFRWAKRWQWTKRASAYDLWQLELSDGLANQNATVHRASAVRLGSALLRRATRSVEQNEVKVTTVDDVVNLAKSGVAIARQALGMEQSETLGQRQAVAQVALSFGSAPPWLTAPLIDASQTNANEAEPRQVVPVAEKVLAETPPIVHRRLLPEKRVNCPKGHPKR